MKAPTLPKMNLPAVDFKQIAEEFRTLDPKDPGLWPLIPRALILIAMFVLLLLAAWWAGWRVQLEELAGKQKVEAQLKEDWLKKKRQAVNLDEYRRQLAEMDRSFGVLLKQLPNKSEMESLLVDINQAGLGRGLQFELFKPGTETMKGFYAELPITVKLTGNYHDLGAFAGDVAKMARIVTLNDIDIAELPRDAKDKGAGLLSMSTTAKTFRYLDEDELAKQKMAAREKAKAGAKKK
ncbi:MAG: type 4a pilus biogenesis protein PilO [Rhodocyclaceae bacterium]|nr:type 4a pilus biogenesis protein PilO [Rhodocyclaceae bacterium]